MCALSKVQLLVRLEVPYSSGLGAGSSEAFLLGQWLEWSRCEAAKCLHRCHSSAAMLQLGFAGVSY